MPRGALGYSGGALNYKGCALYYSAQPLITTVDMPCSPGRVALESNLGPSYSARLLKPNSLALTIPPAKNVRPPKLSRPTRRFRREPGRSALHPPLGPFQAFLEGRSDPRGRR